MKINALTIEQRFDHFHHENPSVYDQFVSFAIDAAHAGASKISAKFILERVRWEHIVQRTTGKPFRFNNDFTSRYARKFIEDFPDQADLFCLRELRTA